MKQDLQNSLQQYVAMAENVAIVKESNIDPKHKMSISEPTFTRKQLAMILEVEESEVDSAINSLSEMGVTFARKGNNAFDFNHDQCIRISEELKIDTLARRRANGEVIKTKTTTVTVGKGGAGKSSTAMMAATHSHFDFKNQPQTVIIDFDDQGTQEHFSSDIISEDEETFTNLIIDNFELSREERLSPEMIAKNREALESMMIIHRLDSIRILPSTSLDKFFSIAYANEIAKAHDNEEVAAKIVACFKDCIITPLEGHYDQIIIDTNPHTDIATLMTLYACTHLIVPTTGRSTDVKAFVDFFPVVAMLSQEFMPEDALNFEMKVLITMHKNQPAIVAKNAKEVMKQFRGNTFQTMIKHSTAFEVSAQLGQPIHCLDNIREAGKKKKQYLTDALVNIDNFYSEYKSWLDWD